MATAIAPVDASRMIDGEVIVALTALNLGPHLRAADQLAGAGDAAEPITFVAGDSR